MKTDFRALVENAKLQVETVNKYITPSIDVFKQVFSTRSLLEENDLGSTDVQYIEIAVVEQIINEGILYDSVGNILETYLEKIDKISDTVKDDNELSDAYVDVYYNVDETIYIVRHFDRNISDFKDEFHDNKYKKVESKVKKLIKDICKIIRLAFKPNISISSLVTIKNKISAKLDDIVSVANSLFSLDRKNETSE